jgi:hypothetical protein
MTQDDIALFKKTSNDSDDVDANVKALAPQGPAAAQGAPRVCRNLNETSKR